jgi:hypothetical protein
VLKDIANTKGLGTKSSVRGKAAHDAATLMMTFDFVFILHVMEEIMGITNLLCKKLQHKSHDIVNAMDDVVSHLVLEKQTKCILVCMPGSSFIHIVDKSEKQ